jgi:HEAT repeat protein
MLACCAADRDPELRKMALSVLVNLVKPEDRIAVQPLTQALGDRDVEIKRNAALALSNIGGPDAAAAVPVVIDALRNGDLELKRQAAAAIKNLGKDAQAAVPALRDALNSPDRELRVNTAVAISGLGEVAEPLVPDLVRHLADTKEAPEVRTKSAVALSRIGPVPEAVKAVPTLLSVLENRANDAEVRERTMWALRVHNVRMRDLGVMPTFTKILEEPKDPRTRMLRYDCAYVLGMLMAEEAPAKAMDTLLDFLKDNQILVYTGTKASTGAVGTEVQGEKVRIQEQGKDDGRVMAVDALDRIGPARVRQRADIMQQLQFLANDRNTLPDLKQKAKELLKTLGQ